MVYDLSEEALPVSSRLTGGSGGGAGGDDDDDVVYFGSS
jgi:hypothetical protein